MAELPTTGAELKKRYNAGERSFRGANLNDANLHGATLPGADLSSAKLADATLADADLSGANFIDANLVGADLRGANLTSANLHGATLSGADLSGAKLANATLADADLSGADLDRAILTRATLRGADLTDADLSGADLTDADLSGADLDRAILTRAILHRADLSGADLTDADLSGADLTRAILHRADLSGAILTSANLSGAEIGRTHLTGVNLSPLCDAEPPVRHDGPSEVNYRAVLMSLRSPNLKGFLQRTGMPEVFVDFMVSCAESIDGSIMKKLLQSTFISYGSPDESFARKLYEALHKNGVTTFFFPVHAVPGKKIGRTMRDGVNDYDRVILICSKASLDRKGVLAEIEHSLSREDRDGGASYVIPVVLDDYLFTGWNPANADIARVLRERVAADFRGADTDPTKFDSGLLRLIGALKK